MLIKDNIKQLSKKYYQDIVDYRRYLHANPELAFQEFNTAKFICEKLKEFNIPYSEGIAETGVVALLEGQNPSKKIIALRAEMDALPIQETNDVTYISKNAGIMHACGHDVHVSSLLGAARILSELRNDLAGTVKFIFQPSEEKLPGGASRMIKEGVLENPKPAVMFGQHVMPELEVGKVGFRSGKYMASTDEIYISVKGKGGHAAQPKSVINPILIASRIIIRLQESDENFTDLSIPSILSFGKVTADGATNIVPDIVKIEGTFRAMDEEWRQKAHEKMKTMAVDIAKEMGGSCKMDIKKGYPFLKNDAILTHRAKSYAEEYLGKDNVVDLDIRMTSDDFSFYSQIIPACFYRFGICNKDRGIDSLVHTSTFDIDEHALELSSGLMAWMVIKEMESLY